MIKEQIYADWSLGVHQRLSTKRIPINGSIEVTQRCNNKCVHCYNNLSAGDRKAQEKELSLAEWYRILNEITEAGCLWLLFTGGEIFIREDFFDIYTYARQKGLLITLFTNGTLITSDIADYLAQIPPFSIEITIYGHTRKTYESITKMPGSYDRCINGIQLLMDRKLPLKLKTMAITNNRHEIQDMKQSVENDLGLEFKFDAMINPRLDCSQSPLNVRLTPAEVVELDLKHSERVSEWIRFADQFSKVDIHRDKTDNLYVCGAGNSSFAIDAYGRLSVCILSSADSFNLRQDSFKEGWAKYLPAERQKKALRKTKCTTCLLKSMCGMCPANSELECSDAETPVDFLCQVAHLRTYALSLPIAPHGECEYCSGGSRYEEMVETAEGLRERFALGALPKANR
jgi:radical SAM protein with 4Fe4S-binding SPASM domain